MSDHLHGLLRRFLCLVLFAVGFAHVPSYSITADQIAAALDNPAGVTFGVGNGNWKAESKATFKAGDVANIPTVGGDYLWAEAPSSSQKSANTFTLRVRGAGTLRFNCQVSLDVYRSSVLLVYENNDPSDGYVTPYGWWDKGDYTAEDWWQEVEIDLDAARYTHDVTFAVVGPEEAGDDDDDLDRGNLLKKAWLDNFVWEPETEIVMLEFEPDPLVSPTFVNKASVSFFPGYENLSVRYTTDGSKPSAQSSLYEVDHDFHITETTTIKAMLFEDGQPIDDTVYIATYTKKTASPDFTFAPGALTFPAEVSFTSETAGSVFYYALGGALPQVNADGTPGAGTLQGTTYTLSGGTTISVVAVAPGALQSDVVTRIFPGFEFSPNTFTGSARVSFTCDTAGAEFYYALGGAQPQVNADGTPGAGTYKGAAYTLNGDTTISVMATAPGAVNSEVVTRTFSKLAKPTLACLLDGQAYSEPPVFDQQATVTLAGPAGATIYYKIDNGAEQIYTAPLVLTASAYVTAQARQDGKISSDAVQSQVIKTSTPVALPALTGGGWQVFAVPGEISQSNSDAIIAARQPVAYDAPRRVYAKASRIRGGHAYWVFGEKPALSGISMAPIEAISGTTRKWQFTGAPSTGEFPVPDYFLAHRWDAQQKRFVKTDVIGAYGGLWLYNMGVGR